MIVDRLAIAEFVAASGFQVENGPRPHRLRAVRIKPSGVDEGEGPEVLDLWLPKLASPEPSRTEIVTELKAAAAVDPGALRLVLLPTQTSLSAAFQSEVAEAGGAVLNYGYFFDAPFTQSPKTETGIGARSGEATEATELAQSLLKPERLDADILQAVLRPQRKALLSRPPERVPQPYYMRESLDPLAKREPDGHDLLQHLIVRLSQPAASPEVTLIVGHAGIGKSYLFEALFTYLHEGCLLAKSRQQIPVRPIPVLPSSLLRAQSFSTEALFAAVAETEAAGALGPALLDWTTRRGQTILMIDGLDEFFADQDDFFAEIQKRYLGEESRARIFIVLRDSLLSTSPEVRKLVDDLAADPHCLLSIYEIALWERRDQKRLMAWQRLAKRRPQPYESDPEPVRRFLAALEASPVLDDLARLPFYCKLLLDRFEESPDQSLPADQFALLDHAVSELVAREWRKLAESPDGAAVPETMFVTGLDRLRLLRDRIVADSRLLGVTSVMNAAFGGVAIDPTEAGSLRRLVDASYAERGEAAFVALLEAAAYRLRRRPAGTGAHEDRPAAGGIGVASLAEIYGSRRHFAQSAPERAKAERVLRQFALFTVGSEGGVDVTHEIIADYLAARHILAEAKVDPRRFIHLVGEPAADETPVFAGQLSAALARDPTLRAAVRDVAAKTSPAWLAYVEGLTAAA